MNPTLAQEELPSRPEPAIASDTALLVREVSKTYHLWSTPASRLWVPLLLRVAHSIPSRPVSNWFANRAHARLHRHEALHSISFTLKRGEALGIIGHNGSGKSTLLQIIAGVLQPTRGTVSVNGRVAALLELGSGFNPELTGRENVRVNAAILGLDPAQIRERMDDILAFADIGSFVDEPVKSYSSGMALRLAFAVQAQVEPQVLIVDEAQNTSRLQMKMVLTRLGEGARMVVTGDPSQIDLLNPRDSGLAHALRILDGVQGVGILKFAAEDVVRHAMVERIVRAYDADAARRLPAPDLEDTE